MEEDEVNTKFPKSLALIVPFVAINLVSVGMALFAFQACDSSLYDMENSLIVGLLLLVLPVFSLGMFTGLWIPGRMRKYSRLVEREPMELLHWFNNIERRGIGDAIQRINHIAIIVADVGRSLAFYTEVMGFQQIRRPNFDRHGAWLTVGNTELHLIKGVPCVHDGEDLIVSHIALDAEKPLEVLEKLIDMNIPFRQNVSVPDPLKSSNNREEDFSSAEGKVTQFFIRDPDGYYLEICNCDILTKFCLMKEEKLRQAMNSWDTVYYREGLPFRMGFGYYAKIGIIMKRMKKRVRQNLRNGYASMLAQHLVGVQRAKEVDMLKLQTLEKRKKTYCDIIQGFSSAEIKEALLMADNSVPLAILILKADLGDLRPAIPPSYFCPDNDECVAHGRESLQPRRFHIEVVRPNSKGSEQLARACKPFNDRIPSQQDAVHYAKKPGTPVSFQRRIGNKVCAALTGVDDVVQPRTVSKTTTDSTSATDSMAGSMDSSMDNIMPGTPFEMGSFDDIKQTQFDVDSLINQLEVASSDDECAPLSPKVPLTKKGSGGFAITFPRT